MALLFVLLLVFAAAAALAFHRWGIAGVVGVALLAIAIDTVRGTVEWWLPHSDFGRPRPWDWPCHATGALFPVLLLGAGLAAILHFTRTTVPQLGMRVAVAMVTSLLLAFPMIYVAIVWGVGVLACDTL